ncbi:MAG: pyruvate carboxylase [Alphaproteobacteria bacterium]
MAPSRPSPQPIRKLLVANRSEIAIRVFRGATELGIQTVAVYAHEDRFALHRFKADEAYEIGVGMEPIAAYLSVEEIIRVAQLSGADAIHPGYGFLSESPELAAAADAAGITFVGPRAQTLIDLGDKVASRKLAEAANVPTVPATDALPDGDAAADAAGEKIGLPVMVKASWGGGGRGMRRVYDADKLAEEVAIAKREAAAAFGKDDVYLEKLIEHARHVEVQVIGDTHGNVTHLFERDCSVQRRNQKVVEMAPATWLDEDTRQGMCQAAVRLAETAGYQNAGTVEFLYDVRDGAFYFIEVNPRIQVEHTVTEEVTSVDIVKTQLLIAGGATLAEAGVPEAEEDRRPRGVAIQCRVTTEDPENAFVPDYGKIVAYRSPAGFGVRLDGGTAFAGAVVTPHYDSLLAKVTVHAPDRDQGIARMSRALAEFRIRGIKTNLPFLQRVVRHDDFRTGVLTTRFIDDTPELFHFPPRRDRASKLLKFLGETVVNGNPEMEGRPAVARAPLQRLPLVDADTKHRETAKTVFDRDGAAGLVKWIGAQDRLLVTDTTFRDAHQSLLATRMRTADLVAPMAAYENGLRGLFSLEVWGGATFDVAYRFLKEDPWQRLEQMRAAAPSHLFQMLLRGSNAVGYTNYPDNVVKDFVVKAFDNGRGVDVFRVFDSLNWVDNMRVAIDAVIDAGAICEATICYSGDLLSPDEDKYTLAYYVDMARQFEAAGAHTLAIKDMAGVARPAAAAKLVETLKGEVGLPIHFHTHDTSGGQVATVLAASAAGVDIIDAAMDPLSGLTSQPNLGTIAEALRGLERDPELPRDTLDKIAHYWDGARRHYAAFEADMRAGSSDVFEHAMPGGQYTNLRQQARSLGIEHRWPEVVKRYADVNRLFGNIVKVTPSSKVVGDMALFMVSHNLSPKDVTNPDKEVAFPDSVVSFFRGDLGQPTGGFPQALQTKVLRGEAPLSERPGASLPPVDFAAVRAELAETFGRKPESVSDQDIAAYVLYPKVFLDFASHRRDFGDTSLLPTPVFFYGPEVGEELSVEIDAGKRLIIRLLAVSDPDAKGRRTVFFELNGQPRNVVIQDKNAAADITARPVATGAPGEVAAPMPGAIVTVNVTVGDEVKKGDVLLSLEAMKMETSVYADRDGRVSEVFVKSGDQVDAKDLLLKFED